MNWQLLGDIASCVFVCGDAACPRPGYTLHPELKRPSCSRDEARRAQVRLRPHRRSQREVQGRRLLGCAGRALGAASRSQSSERAPRAPDAGGPGIGNCFLARGTRRAVGVRIVVSSVAVGDGRAGRSCGQRGSVGRLTSRRSCSEARFRTQPLPARMSGVLASRSRSKARRTDLWSGAGRRSLRGGMGACPDWWPAMSSGSSTRTAPGFSISAILNALRRTSGMLSGW